MCDVFLKSGVTILSLVYPLDLCCDNCIRKKDPSRHFKSIYDLIGFLDTAYGRESISHPAGDNNSDLESTSLPKTWGTLHAGNRLTLRHQVLEDWRYDCWKRDYKLCSWGVTGVMPDLVLSKLALSIKIETVDDLLDAVSNWGYASEYGHEVLLLLKGADRKQKLESQAQRTKTRQANKKRKLEDMEGNREQEDLEGSTYDGSSAAPRAQMIIPIFVKHVSLPTRQPPHPQPRAPNPQPLHSQPPLPQPPRPQPRPVFFSRPYTRTNVFDSLTNNSRSM